MKQKVIILGGRSWTSVCQRLVEAAGYKAWKSGNSTEPNIAQEIYEDPSDIERIEKALDYDDWEVAKLPEFSWCIPMLIERHNPKFIWMDRGIDDRVASHERLGWNTIIQQRCELFPRLQHFIDGSSSRKYFEKLDDFNRYYIAEMANQGLMKTTYNKLLNHAMDFRKELITFLDVDMTPAICDKWNDILSKPQQAGQFKGR